MKLFNKNDYPFEILGFYKDYYIADSMRFLGSEILKGLEVPDMELGINGEIETELTNTINLRNSYNSIKFTPSKGVKYKIQMYPLCGQLKNKNFFIYKN